MARSTAWKRLAATFTLHKDYNVKPVAFKLRTHTLFIIATVGVGLFTDLFLYGLVVPILPYLLQDKVGLAEDKVQATTSALLAAYAGASVLCSPFAGAIADRTSSRQLPFLGGLSALILATILLFTGRTVAVLAFARVAQGASSAFVWTVGLALALDTVGSGNMGKTIGSIFSFISVGELFAPLVGGALYQKAGEGAVLGVSVGILMIDLIMRLLVIEKKVAARYNAKDPSTTREDAADDEDRSQHSEDEPDEDSPLLDSNGTKKEENDEYLIPADYHKSAILRRVPIFYCLRSPSLLVAFLVALVQAALISAFDGTIPTQASAVYGFDPLRSGLLFIPIGVCNLVVGPLAGWAVDRYGVKPAAVGGYAYLVPILALFKISGPGTKGLTIYAVLLGFAGVGLAVIGAPSIVEAGAVVEKYYKRNPDVFGEQGPYAQLYGFNSMVFSAGLSVGPVLAGGLKDSIGYGNMNAILATISGITAILSFIWLGGKPRILSKLRQH